MTLAHIFRSALLSIALISLAATGLHAADDASKTPPPAKVSALDRFEANVRSLKLTDDQKPKIDAFFAAARKELQAVPDDATPADREKKSHQISTKLRSEVGEVLTNEQKAELIKKMSPSANTDSIIEQIKKALNDPSRKLTADQKAKANAVLDDTKKQLDEIMAQARQTQIDPAPKVQEAIAEMKKKLAPILAGE